MLISTSLNQNSKSSLLIDRCIDLIDDKEFTSSKIDLREVDIPFCDARGMKDYPQHIQDMYSQIENADYIVFGFPIYCYSISGVLKNFIDLFSHAMTNKFFGVCAAAGSNRSYLAISDLYTILSFESNSTGVQPSVVVDGSDFTDGILNDNISKRIGIMLEVLSRSKN